LITWYQNQAAGFAKIDPGCPIAEILETEAEIAQDYANEEGLDHQPYNHPFHWAGFTLTGKVPSEP
jgi:CHAT domain-containing protein